MQLSFIPYHLKIFYELTLRGPNFFQNSIESPASICQMFERNNNWLKFQFNVLLVTYI